MRKSILVIIITLLIASIAWAGQKMSVQIREAKVKSSPSFVSQNVGTVTYGTRVDVTAEEENWANIASPPGWMHKSALTRRQISGAGTNYAGNKVSHDETALAGKGFNPRVEAEFVRENRGLEAAYRDVDRVEKFTASDSALSQFAQSGNLSLR